MRIFSALFLGLFLTACAADMPLENSGVDTTYSSPVARDTQPSPPQSADQAAAPTPYGMVIEPDATSPAGAKGTASATESAPALAAQRLLTGRWVNSADDQETVQFTPTHYKTFYEDKLLVEEDMTFYGQCPAACSGGTSTGEPCFTISGPAQTDCYGIVRLTDDLLELQLLGISTETVVYRRAD
ncbi:hypothetical protein [Neolewinella litorea]|uniref:Lipocalin-like domain-containing protein n=1 Tax=Neolewinella litorea TaxID=2562452 RepID=A0A4S4NQT8_9BACT|nr:hypothetical protein [Neolewinella litorea]THH41537.1 hypothetical protein E4021_02790 [Neolewinella litorea]